MTEYRRKQFYIDKIFQNRFLTLFIALGIFSSIANYIFMVTYLKNDVEKYIYKSHISIDNVNQSIVNSLLNFNILLVLAALIFALLFYTLIRVKIQNFFKKVYLAVFIRLGYSELEDFSHHLPKMFQDIDVILGKLFDKIDKKIEKEQAFMKNVKKFVDNPNLEEIDEILN